MKPKAIYIEIRYADGSQDIAQGEVATKIWEWLDSGQVMNCIHGSDYRGPQFEHSDGPRGKAA